MFDFGIELLISWKIWKSVTHSLKSVLWPSLSFQTLTQYRVLKGVLGHLLHTFRQMQDHFPL